jgi:hypothetical protein
LFLMRIYGMRAAMDSGTAETAAVLGGASIALAGWLMLAIRGRPAAGKVAIDARRGLLPP